MWRAVWILAGIAATEWQEDVRLHIPSLILRTFVTFVTVLLIVRWTGKRSVANLAPFDLALVILIGEVAAIPIGDLKHSILHGLVPVVLLGALHVLMTTINLYSRTFERLTEGLPTLLVKDGRVLRKNLMKERVSMIDLESALRQKAVSDLARVKEARMEPAGGVSVILREEGSPEAPELEQAIERILQANTARLRLELEQLFRQQPDHRGGT